VGTDSPPKAKANYTLVDIFEQLTANGVQGGVYQNIRKNTNYNSPVIGKGLVSLWNYPLS
jgi:hypothetical protein